MIKKRKVIRTGNVINKTATVVSSGAREVSASPKGYGDFHSCAHCKGAFNVVRVCSYFDPRSVVCVDSRDGCSSEKLLSQGVINGSSEFLPLTCCPQASCFHLPTPFFSSEMGVVPCARRFTVDSIDSSVSPPPLLFVPGQSFNAAPVMPAWLHPPAPHFAQGSEVYPLDEHFGEGDEVVHVWLFPDGSVRRFMQSLDRVRHLARIAAWSEHYLVYREAGSKGLEVIRYFFPGVFRYYHKETGVLDKDVPAWLQRLLEE